MNFPFFFIYHVSSCSFCKVLLNKTYKIKFIIVFLYLSSTVYVSLIYNPPEYGFVTRVLVTKRTYRYKHTRTRTYKN